MRNSKKLAALFCAAALILSAAACSGGGDTASKASASESTVSTAESDQPQNSENTADSSNESSNESSVESSAENSAESSAESSEESSAPEPGNVLNWTFREVEKPTIAEPVYTTHPETADEYEKETVTIKPMEFFDFEKAKEAIKKSPRFAGLEFVEVVKENQNYHRSATDTIFVHPKRTTYFLGYDSDPETIRNDYLNRNMTDIYNDKIRVLLCIEQDYSAYDSPENFTFSILNSEITQDEVYEEAKAIFGEKLAEYLVYQKYEYQYDDEHQDTMRDEIKAPNAEKLYYVFAREAYIINGISHVSLGTEAYSRIPDEFRNGYKPVEWSIPLSQMLAYDVGDTDYLKPETFFNKAFAANTKYDSYSSSVIESMSVSQAYFSDGGVTESVFIRGYRTPADNNYNSSWGSLSNFKDRMIEISVTMGKGTDNKITVSDFSMKYPLGYISNTDDLKPGIVDELLDLGKQQAIELLGLDGKALDGMELTTDDELSDPMFKEIEHTGRIDNVKFKVFGNDRLADISIYSHAKLSYGGTEDQESEYGAVIRIGDIY